ncbi:DUF721 domain-containing protein [Candidatus Poribacteria bacterium]|nr:DUF721 domain-containing protein [Candidatus Poribacteria bacterium]
MDKTRNLHHLLAELIRKRDLEPKMLEQKVFVLWAKYLRTHISMPLSTKTVPVSLSDGILKIYTEYPAYKTALSFHKPKILADINAELGQSALTDLRIEIRPLRSAESHETEDKPSSAKALKGNATMNRNIRQVTPEQLEKIEQTLASVSDPQLRESLWQLFTTQSKDEP